MAETERAKLLVHLPVDEWHGYATETLWATVNGADTVVVENTPFYVHGLSFKDVVRVIRAGAGAQIFTFSQVHARSGHSTYRTVGDMPVDGLINSAIVKQLIELGCTYESSELHEKVLLAWDLPPESNIHSAYEAFVAGESAGFWEFEEGHCGHDVS